MEKQNLNLSLYEQFGYLLVGAAVLILLQFNKSAFGVGVDVTDDWLLRLLLSYGLGHIVQALVNAIRPKPKYDYDERQKDVLGQARKRLKVSKATSDSAVWSLCYHLALAKPGAGRILESFNANYGLYRGWTAVFALEAVFIWLLSVLRWTEAYAAPLLAAVLLAWLFGRRAQRFLNYLTDKTLTYYQLIDKELI